MHHPRLAGSLAACAVLVLLLAAPVALAREVPKSNPDVLTQAKSLLGVPYKQGGTTAKGLDGPGLAQLASKRAGLWLPAQARRQAAHGVAIGRRLLEPGDLVFSRNFAREGVYVGGGVVLTARARKGVTYLSMSRLGARLRCRRYDADTGYHAAFLAKQNLGAPYVFGGVSPSGFDASGLTIYVYAQVGVKLSHGATDQQRAATPISVSNLRRGDLVFFGGSEFSSHVGIYLGRGMMIDAPHAGAVVSRSPITGAWIGGRLLPVR